MSFALLLLLFVAPSPEPRFAQPLAEGKRLQAAGALREARQAYRAALKDIRAAGDRPALGRALGELAALETSLGEYQAAIAAGEEATAVCRELRDDRCESRSLNEVGLALLYQAEYARALESFQLSAEVARRAGDREQEIYRLNNIGNTFYYQGHYLDALRAYQQARELAGRGSETWRGRARRFSELNLASLHLRLGRHEAALKLYESLGAERDALSPAEQGYLQVNLGVLYRRLGDPYKALAAYAGAQRIFTAAHRVEGEIGALRNMGITLAIDLRDYPAALARFSAALKLAEGGRNRRDAMQVRLYRGEVFYRMGRYRDAAGEWRTALETARALGTAEEDWKALYGLGRAAAAEGDDGGARGYYRQAVARIESVRSRLHTPALRSDFLFDKREVYDALLSSLLRQGRPVEEFLSVLERARARNLQEQAGRARGAAATPPSELRALQPKLDDATLLLAFWSSSRGSAVVWLTRSESGLESIALTDAKLEELLERISAPGGGDWRAVAEAVSAELLGRVRPLGRPGLRRLVVVPDGSLARLPFEVLPSSGGSLLLERYAVCYLPAASLLVPPRGGARRPPWATELVALGDPLAEGKQTEPGAMMPGDESWSGLPRSAEEVRAIPSVLAGRAEVRIGAEARKRALLEVSGRNVPVLHLGTHAAVDLEDPARSRLLLAGERPAGGFDYVFLPEIYGLDLSRVHLATLSGCETERGRLQRGEGIQSFGRAFLAAGAHSTLTTLWRVADGPTADFMKQFYYQAGQGIDKAEALRRAKRKLLGSGTRLAHPYYWAAFVLNGDGFSALPRPLPWSVVLAPVAVLLIVLLSLRSRLVNGRHRARSEAPTTPGREPRPYG